MEITVAKAVAILLTVWGTIFPAFLISEWLKKKRIIEVLNYEIGALKALIERYKEKDKTIADLEKELARLKFWVELIRLIKMRKWKNLKRFMYKK